MIRPLLAAACVLTGVACTPRIRETVDLNRAWQSVATTPTIERQAGARSDLLRMYIFDQAYHARHGRYCFAEPACESPTPRSDYLLRLASGKVFRRRTGSEGDGAALEQAACRFQQGAFAVAVANLGGNGALDVWTIDEQGELHHPSSYLAEAPSPAATIKTAGGVR